MFKFRWASFILTVISVYLCGSLLGSKMVEYINYVGHDYGRDGGLYFTIPSFLDIATWVIIPSLLIFILLYLLFTFIQNKFFT